MSIDSLIFFEFSYGMDVIGTIGFGLDVNSIENPNEPFRRIDEEIRNGAFVSRIRLIGGFFCPKYYEILSLNLNQVDD